MKKAALALLILSICFIPYTANAALSDSDNDSTPGVNFEKLSYAEVLSKAQKDNKYVLVEFYSPT
jgi:hypothetical protein